MALCCICVLAPLIAQPALAASGDGRISVHVEQEEGTGLEGDTEVTEAVMRISLSKQSADTILVAYQTVGYWAVVGPLETGCPLGDFFQTCSTPGQDYLDSAGILTFPPGVTTRRLTVKILPDNHPEQVELVGLEVQMLDAEGRPAEAVGGVMDFVAIYDDESNLSASSVEVLEADDGTLDVLLTVYVHGSFGAATRPVFKTTTVDYKTMQFGPGSFPKDEIASAGVDYVRSSGTLTFFPGEWHKSIVLKVKGDSVKELDESFYVELSNPQNAEVTRPEGTITVRDDGDSALVQTIKDDMVNVPASLSLEPQNTAGRVGTTHTITATVRDAYRTPVAVTNIRFEVAGRNGVAPQASSGSGTTDSAGVASFSYSGIVPGKDTITAFADDNGDGVWQSSEPRATATRRWTPSGPGPSQRGGGLLRD